MIKSKYLLFVLIAFIILFPLFQTIYQNRQQIFKKFELGFYDSMYNSSQYVKKNGGSIPDEFLFSYAGWKYLKGTSPILLNPENPPLGKYLVSLSILLFNNEKIISLIFGLLCLWSFYLVCQLFIDDKIIVWLPVLILSWSRLFRQQLIYLPLFETLSLTILNLAFYFFIKDKNQKGYFILANLFLGALWATRPWMATVPLIMTWVVYLLFVQKDLKQSLFWLITTPIALVVLLLSYSKLFLEGWSVYKVLSVQKWILWYHQSRLINVGSVWPLIYLNQWHVWWGDKPYLSMAQWSIFWPIFTTLALIFSILVIFKIIGFQKKWLKNLQFDRKISLICFWVILYLVFLSVGNINSRYLFYLLPYEYLLGIYFLVTVIKNIKKRSVSPYA